MRQFTLEEYIFEIIIPALGDTMILLVSTCVLSILFGSILAIILVVTKENGLHPNKIVYKTLDVITNIIRSFPFLILMVSLVPLTRLIVGSALGIKAAMVPLTIAMTPFVGRLIESNLQEVNPQLVEAARSFGATDWQIIWNVLIVEALPGIISSIVFTVVTGLDSTSVAGTVGAGGIGTVALRYGYQSFNEGVMYSCVLILLVMVQIIQIIGNKIYQRVK